MSMSSQSFHDFSQRLEEFESRDAEQGEEIARELERVRSGRKPKHTPSVKSVKEEGDEDEFLVTWDSKDSQENPRNWPVAKKVRIMAVVSFFSLMGPYSSSMVSPASDAIASALETPNETEKTLLVSVFVLAYMFGPMFSSPISEAKGRRPVLLICNLIVLPMGGGSIADLFEPSQRGVAMSMYALTPLFGPSIGPVVSGWIIQGWGPDKWQWIFWTSTMLSVAVEVAGFLLIPETYAPELLRKKGQRLRKHTGNEKLHTVYDVGSETLSQTIRRVLLRPMIFMTTELVVILPSLYMSIIYGCFYLLIATLPMVFEFHYGMPVGISALHNLAMAAGVTAGSFTLGPLTDYTYKRLSREHGQPQPEFKLPILMIAVFFAPIGLLIYGWTSEYKVFWLVPDIGLFIVSAGMLGVFLQIQMYLVDVMSIYGSSAISAAIFMRSLLGFVFPLFAHQMFNSLGFGWGCSIIALVCAVIGIPSPYLLWAYGPALRRRSKYAVKPSLQQDK
ncbi:hypothetical protein MCUN1_002816 [Malassezia cuniculi]|uniref:Major facilitator superfamily (MFS) profile domain-containing protein n=1 Tax=Malassezia cuniculi TaxID=948313 RepID=A0AAF0EVR1_9BASI|nr:hypothetical protein MCUN1_002816 [Malassezia cuniculi]